MDGTQVSEQLKSDGNSRSSRRVRETEMGHADAEPAIKKTKSTKVDEEYVPSTSTSQSLVIHLLQPDTVNQLKCGFSDIHPEEICIITMQLLLQEGKGEAWSLDDLIARIKELKRISLYFKFSLQKYLRELPLTILVKRRMTNFGDKHQLHELLLPVPVMKSIKQIDLRHSFGGPYGEMPQLLNVLKKKSIRVKEFVGCRKGSYRDDKEWEMILAYCEKTKCRVRIDYFTPPRDEMTTRLFSITNSIKRLSLAALMQAEKVKNLFSLLAEYHIPVYDWNFCQITGDLPIDEMQQYFAQYPPKYTIDHNLSIDKCHQLLSSFDGLSMQPINRFDLPEVQVDAALSIADKQKLKNMIKIGLRIAKTVSYSDKRWPERFADDDVLSVLEEEVLKDFPGKISLIWGSNSYVKWSLLKRQRLALGKIRKIHGKVIVASEEEEIEAKAILIDEFGIELDDGIEKQTSQRMNGDFYKEWKSDHGRYDYDYDYRYSDGIYWAERNGLW